MSELFMFSNDDGDGDQKDSQKIWWTGYHLLREMTMKNNP